MTVCDIFLDRVESDGIIVGTNNADEIPVGTVFAQLVIRTGETSSASTITPVSLRLTDAIIYRRSVAAVPRGWSAGLRFEGSGLDAIADALDGKVAGEFVHLRTAGAV